MSNLKGKVELTATKDTKVVMRGWSGGGDWEKLDKM